MHTTARAYSNTQFVGAGVLAVSFVSIVSIAVCCGVLWCVVVCCVQPNQPRHMFDTVCTCVHMMYYLTNQHSQHNQHNQHNQPGKPLQIGIIDLKVVRHVKVACQDFIAQAGKRGRKFLTVLLRHVKV